MAGWDAWTASMEGQGAHHCAIYGRDGNPWTCKNMSISPQEVQHVEDVMKNKRDEIFASGVTLHGEKWTPLVLDPDSSVLVVKGKEACNKEKTMTLCLTKQAVVCGCNKDASVDGRTIRKVVENTKAELEKLDF